MKKRHYTEKQRENQRKLSRKHYKNNKDYYKEKNRINKKKSKEWFKKFLENKCCTICKESDSATFDFHHLDPNKKEHNIGKLAGTTYSIKKLQKELEKCVLLCSNCHRKVHAGTLLL